MTTKYNGWTNYETWCVNLWMTNDAGSDTHWRETAFTCLRAASATKVLSEHEAAIGDLADLMEEYHTDNSPVSASECGVYGDLLSASLQSVDWHEIARHFIDDAAEDGEDDEDIYIDERDEEDREIHLYDENEVQS